ncbi:hypothetical protein [Nocardia rhizosphaerihabitans]|uniref:Abi-like protein n=1 Tax=Nocardia rhizosphaerihabitans TaxID=1691570 RepID=A0ABQ2KNW2_9NOCA|nr:hypothetical protein [Nocardia rhizosphaerihabitans]GGN88765.1 hypothetical protein GCM10011610_46550 [Nocardia rhizosphaerihabitans]
MSERTVTVEVTRYLSVPRLAPYLAEVGGDPAHALALYHWNLQLGSAFQEVLAVVEVVVRNAIDERLRAWNVTRGTDPAGLPYSTDWTLRPAPPLSGLLRTALGPATEHAKRAKASREPGHKRLHAPISHDDVLAQLSFSVWKKLLPPAAPGNAGRQKLWSNALVQAFPQQGGPVANQSLRTPIENLVYDRMERLVSLRNRVAHMESLLQVNVPARLSDSLSLLAYISPPTRDWCAGISRVTEVNAARPVR